MHRPLAVSIFAIFNIVFGLWGLVSLPLDVLICLGKFQSGNPIVQALYQNPLYLNLMRATTIWVAFAMVALIASGIGLWRLRPWARRLALIYAALAIPRAIGTAAVGVMIYLPMLDRPFPPGPRQAEAWTEHYMSIGGLVGAIGGGALGLIYPGCLLFFLLRSKIRAAFYPIEAELIDRSVEPLSGGPTSSNPYQSPWR